MADSAIRLRLRGTTPLNLDSKGRFALPTKYRDTINDCCDGQLVMTVDPAGRCLLIYPEPVFEQIEDAILDAPNATEDMRKLERTVLGCAESIKLDSASRLLVSPYLRQTGQLDKKMILTGQGNKFELWNEENWNEYMQSQVIPEMSDAIRQIKI
ncbi:division/cell wall cluster transcriptional repressor MraZ [Marinicellulosiphila megalodicopiae]|uniref:division/cell wall cluster transcriptional repressor MraZ n=1 Tax=Marinicellulosiphila megalodicopiae TaxID=2724896 RepID=UPI003BB0E2DA